MKQTAVEWLEEQIKSKAVNLPTNTKENRMAKGIYVDCLMMIKQAKEIEKQQKHQSIDNQIGILKVTLEEMMTGFDSEEDRIDFILDICNGYKKKINI